MRPSSISSVFLPVMPIGVEHFKIPIELYAKLNVFLPVMPIGVEHIAIRIPEFRDLPSVPTCDANTLKVSNN